MKKLVFVIPAYNEEKTIGTTLGDLRKHFPKTDILVVNDGSIDKTKEVALKKGATALTHVLNRGLGASLATGIKAALKKNADIIVTFDADLQHQGNDVNKLIKPLRDGSADAVIGSRFLEKGALEDMPLTKVVGNTVLTGLTNLLSGTKITDSQSGLRAFNKKAAKRLLIICDRYEVSSEIIYDLGKYNLKIQEVPIKAIYDERSKTKGTNIRAGFHILYSMILKKLGVKK